MDTAIIDAWEHWRVREDDDAYEGRINLGPPNDVAAAYECKDQRAADEGDGRGVVVDATMNQGNPSKDRGIGRQG